MPTRGWGEWMSVFPPDNKELDALSPSTYPLAMTHEMRTPTGEEEEAAVIKFLVS